MAIARRGTANGANFTTTRSPVLTLPAGIISGDVILASISANAAVTFTAPAGWTLTKTYAQACVLSRKADGSEGTSYTLTNLMNTTASGQSGAVVYSGCDLNVPLTVATMTFASSFSFPGVPKELPESGMSLVIVGGGYGALSSPSRTAHTGYTEILDSANGNTGWVYIEEQLGMSSGAVSGSPTPSGGSGTGMGTDYAHTIVLIPSVSGVTRAIATTVADDATVGSTAWTTGALGLNIDDGASPSAASGVGTGGSHYLKLTGYGFSVSGTISGVSVYAIVADDASLNTVDSSVKLVKGGTISGTDKARSSSFGWGVYYGADITSWGSPADLWGLTLTSSDVNASNFGVVIAAKTTATTATTHLRNAIISIKQPVTFNTTISTSSTASGSIKKSLGKTVVASATTTAITSAVEQTTQVLDSFNRANTSSIAGSTMNNGDTWSATTIGGGTILDGISSNRLFNAGRSGSSGNLEDIAYSNTALPDGFVSVEIPVMGDDTILLLGRVVPGASHKFYSWEYNPINTPNQDYDLLVRNNGQFSGVDLGHKIGPALTSGDAIGLNIQGSTIEGWARVSGVWQVVVSVIDTSVPGNGKVAVGFQHFGSVVTFADNLSYSRVAPVVGVITNIVTPSIAGQTYVGGTLKALPGEWMHIGGLTGTFLYQWQRDVAGNGVFSNISGATDTTYILKQADKGNKIRCVVTGSNDG